MINKKSAFLSRQMSAAIQAVGVPMMVFHHLFGFHDRINVAKIPPRGTGTAHCPLLQRLSDVILRPIPLRKRSSVHE